MHIERTTYDNYISLLGELPNIEISEKWDKSTCIITCDGEASKQYKGFILSDKPHVKILCDITFFKANSTNKYLPRLSFRKVNKEVETIQRDTKKPLIIDFNDSEKASAFWKLIGILNKFKEIVDLDEFDVPLKIVPKDAYFIEFSTKDEKDKISELTELVRSANLSERQLKSLLLNQRKRTVASFHKLLKNEMYKGKFAIDYYKNKYNLNGGHEAVWHHFFKENEWILGLNVDLKFIRDFIHQARVGVEDTLGKGSPQNDILGISDYTTLIELKTPETSIFKVDKKSGDTSRADTWSFSQEFIDGISQCLGQKFDWDKSNSMKELKNEAGHILDQEVNKTLDPKTIFVIGNRKKEFPHDRRTETNLKSKTFERYRRNSRNVDVITFDELFERAYHSVFDEKIPIGWYDDEAFSVPYLA